MLLLLLSYVLVGVVVLLDGLDPAQHVVVGVGLQQVRAAAVRRQAEDEALLRVVVRDVDDTRLDRDRLLLEQQRALAEDTRHNTRLSVMLSAKRIPYNVLLQNTRYREHKPQRALKGKRKPQNQHALFRNGTVQQGSLLELHGVDFAH